MNILVIYAHPYNKSFNHAIKESIINAAETAQHNVVVRDLYALNFNPVLSASELVNSFKGGEVPEDVRIEQEHLAWAEAVVLVYPLWWAGMPAILRGYLDRIFSYGFAYTATDAGIVGLLGNKRIIMVNTIGAAEEVYQKNGMLNALETIANPGIFNFCGTSVEKYFHFCGIPDSTLTQRQEMLAEIYNYFSSIS